MEISAWLGLLRTPRGLLQLLRDFDPFLRLQFLHAAYSCGLMEALRQPCSQDELTFRLGIKRPELLEGLLALGVALKELSLQQGRYRVRGRRSRLLLREGGDAYAAMIEEIVLYYGSVYAHLAGRLKGAALGDYLEETASLVARSSPIMEPVVKRFIGAVLERQKPVRILEVGCGAGVYLRYAAEINPQATGIGLDLFEEVARTATANLKEWGLAERFQVMVGDVRKVSDRLGGPFDLATLYNNIYYFQPEERGDLFGLLRAKLRPGGGLALVSLFKGSTPSAVNFDLVLQSTAGLFPLPDIEELQAQLLASGFSQTRVFKLFPWEPYCGVLAT